MRQMTNPTMDLMAHSAKTTLTKTALLQEGIQQLAAHGYHGTGIKKILDVVHVPKGSFYNYFASKEAYVAEIIREYNQQSMLLFDQLVADSTLTAVEKLEILYQHMLARYADAQYQKGCLVGNLAAEIGHRYALCQTALQASINNWQTRLTSLIMLAQQEGSIRTDLAPDAIAEILWHTWEGILLRMQVDGDAVVAKRVLSTLFKQLLVPAEK